MVQARAQTQRGTV